MSKSAAAISLLALLVLATTACGWHLRGTVSGNLNFESIYISTADQSSELVRQLKRQLEASDVAIAENAIQAPYTLVIAKEKSTRRTATVSASARVSERSLTEEAEFSVLDSQGASIIPATRVMVERVFEYNENNVLATNDEADLLKREMRSELARQVYNRLRLVNPSAQTIAKPVDAPPG